MIKILLLAFTLVVSINCFAIKCNPVSFPIKKENYSNQEAYLYFSNAKREHLYNYYFDSVLNNKQVIKAKLYKYLYNTEIDINKKVIVETLYKSGLRVKSKKKLCEMVKQIQNIKK